jgi:sialidase-1
MNAAGQAAGALFGLLAYVAAAGSCAGTPEPPQQRPVYVSGENGYHTYRIPALAISTSGTLLGFCEGRKNSRSDSGDIDLLLKRSMDRGKTWTPQSVVWDDSTNTCGNPAPVVDRETGTIWLLMTWNRGEDREHEIIGGKSKDTRRVFAASSKDDGLSWTTPKEITEAVKARNWTWYATGPGAGIQLQRGNFQGRLLIPCDHIEAETKRYFSHVIYSDDHGETWKLGGRTPAPQVNECQVVELNDGRLLLNMRNYDRASHERQIAFSADGGLTWTGQHPDRALPEPICQASIRRCGDAILFSNPAHSRERINLTVRLSRDQGGTWSASRILHQGPGAYSDLADLGGGFAGCLYEGGVKSAYETVTFACLALAWIETPAPVTELSPGPSGQKEP